MSALDDGPMPARAAAAPGGAVLGGAAAGAAAAAAAAAAPPDDAAAASAAWPAPAPLPLPLPFPLPTSAPAPAPLSDAFMWSLRDTQPRDATHPTHVHGVTATVLPRVAQWPHRPTAPQHCTSTAMHRGTLRGTANARNTPQALKTAPENRPKRKQQTHKRAGRRARLIDSSSNNGRRSQIRRPPAQHCKIQHRHTTHFENVLRPA